MADLSEGTDPLSDPAGFAPGAVSGPGLSPDPARGAFSIHDLVRDFAVTSRTLRFYEEKGLLSPARDGEARLYSRRDRARLVYVLKGRAVGFSLDEVRELLDLYDLGDGGVTQLKAALAKFEERIDSLKHQRAEIDRMVVELERAHALTCAKLDKALAGERPAQD
jgi:DNA-binding transcriptional MerR regulator